MASHWTGTVDHPLTDQAITVDDLVAGTNWLPLGRRPGREVVPGATGRIWSPVVQWKHVAPEEFAEFREPSWAKVVVGFTVLPYGGHRGVVAHDIRIFFHDRGTQKTFTMFWSWLIRLLVRIGLRATLRAIRDTAISAVRATC